jgi:hypothetical protein
VENVRLWTQGVPVEPEALAHIANVAALPILGGHVAIMPDVHLGKGATVGSVIPTRGAIIPSAVGVDIGCGMMALGTTLDASDLPDSLGAVRAAIERDVPVGFNAHDAPVAVHGEGLSGSAIHRRMKALKRRYDALRIIGPRSRLARGRHAGVRRVRRGPCLGAGLRGAESRHHDAPRAARAVAVLPRGDRDLGHGRELPSQLREPRGAFRRDDVGHAQGRRVRSRR